MFIDGCESFIPYAEERQVVAQMYTEGTWYTLCSTGFTKETADVICRENSHSGGALSFSSVPRSSGQYRIYSSQLNCTGDEKSACECSRFPISCPSNTIVSIQCRNQGKII